MTAFDPTAIAGLPPKDHNQPVEPHVEIFQQIDDLYDEAKNFADGEPITSEEMHDAITRLYDGLHEAGKKADALRVEEKEPLDKQVKAIQDRYNPYIQAKRGKVDLGKSALGDLLAAYRAAKAAAAKAEADRIAAAAEAARQAANEAMRASSGNLAAREEAETQLADARRLEKTAKRADKAATVGTGLRTTYRADLVNVDDALDHYYNTHKSAFEDLVIGLARQDVISGKRVIPGFNVVEVKVAN